MGKTSVRVGILALWLAGLPLLGQTTQGLISGRVYEGATRKAIANARVCYWRVFQNVTVESGSTLTNEDGYYALSFLSPAIYNVRVEPGGACQPESAVANAREEQVFQPQETDELELFVSARLHLDFSLRRLKEVWGNGTDVYAPGGTAVVHFYAADVASLRSAYIQLVPATTSPMDASVSYVIDPPSVENLPLPGRDIYTTLVLQPAVTAASATSRGLGLSVNGQRPTAANFLLDGVENNNRFLTGPLTAISPEAVQEYRISISNFSAEYGGTGGFLANAVTRSGGNAYHGLGFGYFGNELLNANTFQRNAAGLSSRLPAKEVHTGYQVGGPFIRNRLFFSSEFEQARSRNRQDKQFICVPTASDLSSFSSRLAASLQAPAFELVGVPVFKETQPPGTILPPCTNAAVWQIAPTTSIDRTLALERFDLNSPDASNKLMFRVDLARGSRPDFVFSPYKGFNSRLSEDSTGAALRWVRSVGGNTANEVRAGWTNFDLHWNRPYSKIPALQISSSPVRLPGSELPFDFADRENNAEVSDTLSLVRGRHVITAGGGVRLRYPRTLLSYLRDGIYLFRDTRDFAIAQPTLLTFAVEYDPNQRATDPVKQPDYRRSYSNHEFNLFAQDNFRVTPRVGLSFGVRYDSFGSLRETAGRGVSLLPGTGSSPAEQLSTATFQASQGSLYKPDRKNWAGRFGATYRVADRLVVRGAYGLFYDRLYDNVIENPQLNSIAQQSVTCSPPSCSGLLPPSAVLALPTLRLFPPGSPTMPWWIDDSLRSPRIQSWLAGIQSYITENWTGELLYLGASSSNLIATDIVNRNGDTNESLPEINYQSNSGISSYNGLAALTRFRSTHAQFQIAYTWSHSIDNQSDPLLGHALDLVGASPGQSRTAQGKEIAQFSTEFDGRGDRGNSDLDQRHNLVLYSIWTSPASGPSWSSRLLSGWQFAQLAGFRSGFPVNVVTKLGVRPDLVGGAQYNIDKPAQQAGERVLLDVNAFADPSGLMGSLGRNSIRGPGFWNVDLSVARSFAIRKLGESARLQFRADLFNAFNHANLSPPNAIWVEGDRKTFGHASFGQNTREASFPALVPLADQQRRIELQVKLYF